MTDPQPFDFGAEQAQWTVTFRQWLDGFLPDWESEYSGDVHGLWCAWRAAAEPLPCGHPHACLEEYDDSEEWLFGRPDDAGPALRCTVCCMQEAAVQAEQDRVRKLAEEGAYVINGGQVTFFGNGQIGILTVCGGSVYFMDPPLPMLHGLEPLADPYTVTTLNVPPTLPSPASGHAPA